MSRMIAIRRLTTAALALTGIALACRAAPPGETPPLAPRPEPTEPSPSPVPTVPERANPSGPGRRGPGVDAPMPLTSLPPPVYRSQPSAPAQVDDAGIDDALDPGEPPADGFELLPVPDADLPDSGPYLHHQRHQP